MPSTVHPFILHQVPVWTTQQQTQVDESSSSGSSEGSSSDDSSDSEEQDHYSGSFGRSKGKITPKAEPGNKTRLSTPNFEEGEIPKLNIPFTPRSALIQEKC